jgi:hypothetical protein
MSSEFNLELQQYLKNKLGEPPTPPGSRRRWWILVELAQFIYNSNPTDFNKVRLFVASRLQCLQDRTLRENYLCYLNDLSIISYNVVTGEIKWLGK